MSFKKGNRMQPSPPELPLTPEEKQRLKASKVKLNDIALMELSELAFYLQTSIERAQYLRGLAEFQSVPSIGPKVSERIVQMGFYSLEDIKQTSGEELINRWEEQCGYWEDPCLEDSFRCMVHYANHPTSERTWFDFTDERKRYREQNGYPATRPTVSWQDIFKKTR
ncbi:helix-hairpin-helix domain-containing protein [Paenibacillus alba]|uniref:helix-hairpin-helix domain-containing protein n=1 Tax=Paenibacillus alba TaxID=1197127 RepID=UPI001FE28A5B|nr:helix-hairpin-helix domain-containing protein [Paenibacillus alba]